MFLCWTDGKEEVKVTQVKSHDKSTSFQRRAVCDEISFPASRSPLMTSNKRTSICARENIRARQAGREHQLDCGKDQTRACRGKMRPNDQSL